MQYSLVCLSFLLCLTCLSSPTHSLYAIENPLHIENVPSTKMIFFPYKGYNFFVFFIKFFYIQLKYQEFHDKTV